MNACVGLGGVHVREAALERGQVVRVQARRCHLGRDGLQDPPHLVSSSNVVPVSRSLTKPMPVSSNSGSEPVT